MAGGETGKAFVHDAGDGSELAELQLAPSGKPTFVNDVALTPKAAFFTDSQRAVLYEVSRDLSSTREVPLHGFDFQPGFNLNGIVAARGGKALVAVQSNSGRLWRIDARTGDADAIDLGGDALTNGDGLLLRGRTLYVVQNQDNQIAVVRLAGGLSQGTVERTITHDEFDVPTTLARLGGSLYAVNARFDTPPTPDTEYWITRVPK